MDYETLFATVVESPDEWYFTPINASWWIVLPTELIKGNQESTQYLPSSIQPYLSKFTGDVDLRLLLGDIYTAESQEQPVNLDCVMLLNGKQDSYCLFGSAVTLYENGTVTQFSTK